MKLSVLSIGMVLAILLASFSLVVLTPEQVSAACSGSTYVNGYYRSNGTYVSGHYRTCPDGVPYNNYGYPGNYNPNTGRVTSGSSSTYLRNYYTPSYRSTTPSYSSRYSTPTYTPSYQSSYSSFQRWCDSRWITC